MYTFETSVRLHDTDAAGILFFANQFKFAHDAYESFLRENNLGFARIFNESDYLLPIVHAEADYKATLDVGDKLSVQMKTEKIGDSSFTLSYDIMNSGGDNIGRVRTVHVCMDRGTLLKKTIPAPLRKALNDNF